MNIILYGQYISYIQCNMVHIDKFRSRAQSSSFVYQIILLRLVCVGICVGCNVWLFFYFIYVGALLLTFSQEIYKVLLIVNNLNNINGLKKQESMDKNLSLSAPLMMSMLSAMSILHVQDRSCDSCRTLSIGEDLSDSAFSFFKGTRLNCTQKL